jgi:hypothetical protein
MLHLLLMPLLMSIELLLNEGQKGLWHLDETVLSRAAGPLDPLALPGWDAVVVVWLLCATLLWLLLLGSGDVGLLLGVWRKLLGMRMLLLLVPPGHADAW